MTKDSETAIIASTCAPALAHGAVRRMRGPIRSLAPWMQGIASGAGLLAVIAFCVWLADAVSTTVVRETLDEELTAVARIAAQRIDAKAHAALIDPSQQNGDSYKAVVAPLREMLTATPEFVYMYTMRSSPEGLRFVVDASDAGDNDGDGVNDQADLGELYDDPESAMLEAITSGEACVAREPKSDKWGTFISAFAPVKNADGTIECIVGVDSTAEKYLARLGRIDRAAGLALVAGAFASAGIGFGVFAIQRRRRRSEAALAASEVRFRTLTDAVPAMVWLTGPDKKCTDCNKGWLDFSGRALEQELGDGWADSIHPDERERCLKTYVDAFNGRRPFEMTCRMRRHDGEYRLIDDRGVPRFGPDGTFEGYAGACLDVTEQVEAATRVRLSEEAYRALFEAVPAAVFVCDREAVIQRYNRRAVELWGREPKIGIEKHCGSLRLLLPDGTQLPHDQSPVLGVLRTGEPIRGAEVLIERPDGSRIPVIVNFAALRSGDGTIIGSVVSFDDVSKIKRAERAVAESERRFRTLVEGTDVIVWEYDVSSEAFTYVSPQAARLGYPIEQWHAKGFWPDHIHPEDRDAAVAFCMAETMAGRHHRLQYRMMAADGHIVWIDDVVSVEPASASGGIKLRGVLVDVSMQKNAELRMRAMLDLTARLGKAEHVTQAAEAVIDALEAGAQCRAGSSMCGGMQRTAVLVYGHDDICRFVASRGLSDTYKAAVEGHCPWKPGAMDAEPIVVNDVRNEASMAMYRDLFASEGIGALAFIPLQTERGVVGKIMLYAQYAGQLTVEQIEAAQRVAANAGMSIGRILSTRRLESSEREARGLRLTAEAASRAKSEFLANMSHEIRTPLTAILGYADLLREDGEVALPAEQRAQTIDTIASAGAHLLTVINDILDLSKIEADKMTVERIDTPLVKVLCEVADLMLPRAAGNGLTLTTRLDSPVPEFIVGDPTRLRQVLMNLAGNAVKFTDSGTVTIAARVEHRGSTDTLVVDIEDTGPGLSPEQSRHLFSAFGQADSTVTRKHGGTGLGLTISRRLANLMGGTVTLAYTELGKGSCFRLELPLFVFPGVRMVSDLHAARVSNAVEPAAHATTLAGRILLAEDGVDNQRLITFHLKKAGATVDIAANGRIALEMIDRAEAAGAAYDLLLTDMQMPEMDGYTLTRTLRQRGSELAIVALTAHAMAEDRDKCLRSGCNDYASKPIDKLTLLATCARWMAKSPGNAAVSKAA